MEIRDKIVVIEDDSSIINLLKTILKANNYEVLVAASGVEALTIITSHCPDLVILDLGLPDMNGTELIKSLREWSSIPVIVLSARDHEKDKVEALDLGADDYITKPFGTSELLARIRAALRHRRTTTCRGFTASIKEIPLVSRRVCGGRSKVDRNQSHVTSLVLLGGLRIGLSMTPAAPSACRSPRITMQRKKMP